MRTCVRRFLSPLIAQNDSTTELLRRRLRDLSRITGTIGFVIALAAPTASNGVEIKMLTSRATNHVLTEFAGAFQRTRDHKVVLIFAPPEDQDAHNQR
jgi:hypothetical protein